MKSTSQEIKRNLPDPVFEFTDTGQLSTSEGIPWIEGITASHYGSSYGSCWGGYGNKLYPGTDHFCALPANHDNLDCLGGLLGCKISRCDAAQPTLGELLRVNSDQYEESGEDNETFENNETWETNETFEDNETFDNDETRTEPETSLGDTYGWIIEGTDGDGLFRVIEIKPAGKSEPIIEAYVGDVGPWCTSDAYWEDYSRPDAEDGLDARGRRTNRAGIDVSYALALALGFTGLMEVDWRWKTIDGAYVVRRKPTDWRW